jgi:bifunctional polynucleotide phosphatase/kinase
MLSNKEDICIGFHILFLFFKFSFKIFKIKSLLYNKSFNIKIMSYSSKQLIVLENKFRYRRKMMGLDYDHTIVKPKGKSQFPKDADDWMWLRPNVPEIIRKYYEKGYAIVVFTNQSKQFKIQQIHNVMEQIGVPYCAFIAMDKTIQKPSPFMFNQYKRENIDMKTSFYVGDAMGRHQDWSDSDKLFAINSGLSWKTPEEIFPFKNIMVKTAKKNKVKADASSPKIKIYGPNNQEVVLLVGYPGSGKSTLTKLFDDKSHYDVIHGDDLKTESKMKKALKSGIENGKSVVVDATNPSVKKRAIYISLARELNPKIHVRVIEMSTSIEESLYRNGLREKPVPKIALYLFRKNYEKPTSAEGINEYIVV